MSLYMDINRFSQKHIKLALKIEEQRRKKEDGKINKHIKDCYH